MIKEKEKSFTRSAYKGNLNKEKFLKNYLPKAFSLIELMISLVVVSCITAAFAPAITKKLKTGSLVAGSVGNAFHNMKMGIADCKEFTGIENCSFCDVRKKECKICQFPKEKACDTPKQFERTIDCKCMGCSALLQDCYFCSEKKCEACIAGKYLSDGICKPVNVPIEYTDPDNDITTPKDCPEGSICPNGIKTDCTTEELTHKLCKNGVAQTCPNGSICNDGIETRCNSSNLTNSLCRNGISQICPEGSTCTNGLETRCNNQPNSIWCINGTVQNCPEGSTCTNGRLTSCNGVDVSKRCINGVQINCPEGYTCSNGIAAPCTGAASNVRCINGTETTCNAGYYCTNGVQPNSKCKTGCIECSGASSCSTCADGSYLSGGNCLTCPQNTSSCSGTTFTCKTGYYKSGSTCGRCNSACIACTASGTTSCSSCASGYWYSSNRCYSCPSHASCRGGTNSYVCDTNWSGSRCSTYTPPCTWGWWIGSTKYPNENGTWTYTGDCNAVFKTSGKIQEWLGFCGSSYNYTAEPWCRGENCCSRHDGWLYWCPIMWNDYYSTWVGSKAVWTCN